MPNVYGYGRGSTEEQQATLQIQEEDVKRHFDYKFSKLHDYTWGGVTLDTVSGSTKFRERPGGLKLFARLQPGDVVVITKLDRGFRNTRDFLETLDLLRDKDVRLVMLDLELDTGTPIGRLMATLLAACSEFERERIRERIREGMKHRKAKGLPGNQQRPYGFRWATVGNNKRTLVSDPYQRTWGSRFLAWYEAGWSVEQIYSHCLTLRDENGQRVKNKMCCRRLRSGKKPTKDRNGREWGRHTIDRWIKGEQQLRADEAARKKAADAQAKSSYPDTNNPEATEP